MSPVPERSRCRSAERGEPVEIDSAVPMPMYKSKSYQGACSTVAIKIFTGVSNSFMALKLSLRIIYSIGYDDAMFQECVDRVGKIGCAKKQLWWRGTQ
jgi:hypothetical protein